MKILKALIPLLLACISLSYGQSVGSIDGVFNVSDMGAANYSIPIKMPDGVGGLKPNISINYNSQGGNGPLGIGWSISGLSAITRAGNTIYNDKKVQSPNLSLDDKFSLDGNRLILTSGTYGVAGSLYHTEIESFREITAVGTLGNGPQGFTVKDQEGFTYEYGGAGFCVAAAGNTPYTWLLRKVSDLMGNSMSFSYNIVDGAAYPAFISYNENASLGDASKSFVRFSYSIVPNPSFGYVAGGKVSISRRLDKITVKQVVNATEKISKSYSMEYQQDFYTHLIKITEKGLEQADSFKPTEFKYGDAAPVVTSQLNNIVNPYFDYNEFLTGDFDADGYSDLLTYPKKYNTNLNNQNVYLTLFKNLGNGSFGAPTTVVMPSLIPNNTNVSLVNEKPKNYNNSFFDYNGDGKADFFFQSRFVMQGFPYRNQELYNILISDGNTIAPLKIGNYTARIRLGDENKNAIAEYLQNTVPLLGDFDGDGKSEILAVKETSNGPGGINRSVLIGENYLTPCSGGQFCAGDILVPKLLNDAPFVASYCNVDFPCTIANQPKLIVIDYNGDGKNEILNIDSGIAKVYELNVTFDAYNNPVIGSPSFKLVNSTGYPTIWHKNIQVGDFNGDGSSDLLMFSSGTSGGGWEIGYGKGNGLMNDGRSMPQLNAYIPGDYMLDDGPYNNLFKTPVVVGDFNGDGKSDLFVYPTKKVTPVFQTIQASLEPGIFYSQGNNNFIFESLSSIKPNLALESKNLCFGDFNGDGAVDIITKYPDNPGSYPLYQFAFHPFELKHNIVQITNGLGALTKFQYKSLADPSFTGIVAATYPYVSKKIPIKVVQRSIEDNGLLSGGTSTLYNYSALKFHLHGKGILGFDEISSLNEASGIKTRKIFEVNITTAYRFLTQTFVSYNPNAQIDNPISFSGSLNLIYSYGNKRIFPYQVYSITKDELTGEVSSTTSNYSFYTPPVTGDNGMPGSNYSGKPMSVIVNKGNGLEVTTQTFKYPYRIPTNAQASSGEPYSPYSYTNSKPYKLITTSTRNGQPSYSREVKFNYHPNYGYLISMIADPGTSNTVTTSFWYDYYGNPLRKLMTATGLPDMDDRMTYDVSHRYVIESYNAAFPGIKSKATYDPLSGLKLTNVEPDGFTTSYTYDAFGRITTQSDNNGGLITTSYKWGYIPPNSITPYVPEAVYYIGKISNSGELNYTKFDRLGRELCSSTKNFQNKWLSTKKWYNSLGQVAGNTKPAFSDNTTPPTITNTYDAYGRLIQTNAPEGNTTISYSAPAAGAYTVTQKNVSADQESKIKADFSGRKVEVTDAQGNVMSYTYHSNGEVKSVSALGTTMQNYVYDNFGRLTERQDPNYGSYFYTYNAFGQKTKEKDPKGNEFSYNYDALGRVYHKVGLEGNYDYTFENNQGQNCGKMIMQTGNNGTNVYEYGMGDKINSIDYLDGGTSIGFTGVESFPLSALMNYDALGRLSWKQYPTGAMVAYTYSPNNGDLIKISDYNTGTVFYSKEDENDFGQTTAYSQDLGWGTTVTTKQGYDVNGLLTAQKTLTSGAASTLGLRDLKYLFDPATGNLLSRKDVTRNLEESFTYDKLNRLTNIASPAGNQVFDFEANGNILNKSDAGKFSYDQANRLSKIQPFVNIPIATQQVDYTSFNKVNRVKEGDMETDFLYGANEERNSMYTLLNGEMISFKSYAPDLEREFSLANGDRTWTYIRDPEDKVVAIIAKENGIDKNCLVLTDHLGSFTHIVDANGTVLEEKSYDAWGRLRNPQDWNPYAANLALGQPSYLFDRGYTGHEHLAGYGIINMNGRLYDPLMGRMFSPDVNIVGGGSLQGYNRYSYAMNNPLIYTDPDGNNPIIVGMIVGAIIGGYIGGSTANGNYNPTKWDFSSGRTWGYMLGGAIVGGASGALGGAIAGSGVPFANSAGLSASSLVNSIGTNIYNGGQTGISLSFGFGSYNFSSGEFGYLGKSGNSLLQNVGYVFGALANIQDGFAGLNGGNAEYRAETVDIQHARLRGDNFDISVAHNAHITRYKWTDADDVGVLNNLDYARYWCAHVNKGIYWENSESGLSLMIRNLNTKSLAGMTNNIKHGIGMWGIGKLNYGTTLFGCQSHVAHALWGVGIPTLPINFMPQILYGQLLIRQAGIYASPYLTN